MANPFQDKRVTRHGVTSPQRFGNQSTDSATALAAFFFPSPGVYTITLDVGAFVLTGEDVDLLETHRIGLDTGTFTLTGVDVGLLEAHRITLDTGAFTLTGVDVGLNYSQPNPTAATFPLQSSRVTRQSMTAPQRFGYRSTDFSGAVSEFFFGDDGVASIQLEAGAFAFTGQAVSLIRNARIALETGDFVLTGQNVGLTVPLRLILEPGSFTLTGQAVSLERNRRITLGTGAFVLTGQAVSLEKSHRLILEAGAFALTGRDVELTFAGTSGPNVVDTGLIEVVPKNTGIVVANIPTATSPIGHLFTITARHYRSNRFHDGQGGWGDDFDLLGSIACRMSTPSGRDVQIASMRQAIVTHAVYTSADEDIQYGDGLEIEGRWYIVTVPDLSPSIREHHLKFLTEQRQRRAAA